MRCAVIGIGNMGQHHARIYDELKDAELISVCDMDVKRCKELALKYSCKAYNDYKKMLRDEKLDLISIAVPTSYHYLVAKDCIEQGINVLIEKPITDDISEAQELVHLAEKHDVKILVGQIEVFNPVVTKLKELLSEQKLGKITSVITKRVGVFPSRIKDTNVLIDVGVHDISILNHLFGENNKIISACGGSAIAKGRIDYAELLMDYRGIKTYSQINWLTPIKIRTLSITGTKGYAELDFINQELVLYESNITQKTSVNNYEDLIITFNPTKKYVPINKSEPLKNEIQHFINCIKQNTDPLVNGQAGINILVTAKKAEELIQK